MRRDWPAILLSLPFLGPIAFLSAGVLHAVAGVRPGPLLELPPTLESFGQAWQSATFVLYYRNTVLYTVGLLAVQLGDRHPGRLCAGPHPVRRGASPSSTSCSSSCSCRRLS